MIDACAFCGKRWDPMDHTWACHHAKPFKVQDPDTGKIFEYDEEWLACKDCDALIQVRSKKGLALRVAWSHPGRQPGNLRKLFKIAERLHKAFFDRWMDSHLLYERRDCLIKLPNVQ